jgi:L-ribulose-5-phosphate 3-epimerase
MKRFLERLGVCTWSLKSPNPGNLLCDTQAVGLKRVQLDLDAVRTKRQVWQNVTEVLARQHIQIVSGMFRTVGEDYSSLQRIRETGGLLPDETWDDTWEVAQQTAAIAQPLGIKIVSFHAGFIPQDETDPSFAKMLHRMRLVADVFASHGVDLALETGQERAEVLKDFLHKVGRVNVGVNFDPANMLIYDTGAPADALEILAPWLKQCHIKDGVRPSRAGTLGKEAVVGTGEVNWREFFQVLQKIKFPGYLFIEREAGEHRLEDIRWARQFVERVLSRHTDSVAV